MLLLGRPAASGLSLIGKGGVDSQQSQDVMIRSQDSDLIRWSMTASHPIPIHPNTTANGNMSGLLKQVASAYALAASSMHRCVPAGPRPPTFSFPARSGGAHPPANQTNDPTDRGMHPGPEYRRTRGSASHVVFDERTPARPPPQCLGAMEVAGGGVRSTGAAYPDGLRHLERSHSARQVRKGIGDPREFARCGVELPAASRSPHGQPTARSRVQMRDMTYVAKRDVRCVCEAGLDGDAMTAGILASPAFGFPRALLRLLRATRNPSPRLSWATSIPRTSRVITESAKAKTYRGIEVERVDSSGANERRGEERRGEEVKCGECGAPAPRCSRWFHTLEADVRVETRKRDGACRAREDKKAADNRGGRQREKANEREALPDARSWLGDPRGRDTGGPSSREPGRLQSTTASGLPFCAPEVGVCILVHEMSEVPAILGLLGIAVGMPIQHILLRGTEWGGGKVDFEEGI
ncbi:hypothetical protein HETIRDRAFT_447092 [Heterobasidion irregulare TC 32-1]|uniref:Uncharacterized protein n=1 Tax=Heterobasidion irregulare (strain TC 32-1) TaxID=747525 RepID=W4JMM4_HETIT|nr:uncharacterized protein HETIRDRAFT_447092 [Heterobasidion irregulare TC 32-1]ETW74792.1 hypothetical protein HETIRDRAFT_447092 [Heterobasidion irregulare TC 32-1]